MGYFGADVEQLRQLGAEFERAAAELDTTRRRVDVLLHDTSWQGPAADRFRAEWQGSGRARVEAARRATMEAAVALRRNAEQQAEASRADGGLGATAGSAATQASGSTFADVEHAVIERLLEVKDAAGHALDVESIAHVLTDFHEGRLLSAVGEYAWALDALTGSYTVMQDIRDHDPLAAVGDAAQTVLNVGPEAASTVARMAAASATGAAAEGAAAAGAGFGVVGVGVGALVGWAHFGIPVTHGDQDAMMSYVLHQRFPDEHIDVNDLTSQQADWYQQRYTGPMGVGNMISDQMNTVGHEVAHAAGPVLRRIAGLFA